MLLRPQPQDLRIIGFYLGKIVIGLSLFMLIPMIIALLIGERAACMDFLISFMAALIFGLALHIFCYTEEDARWGHGMIVVSVSWVFASLIAALPLYLSGHFLTYLDATFEAVSGFTTSGLSLANDLAHMGYSYNIWRHLTHFIGGQGLVVVILSFFVTGASGSMRLYVGEARDERVMPNIRRTSQFIWTVSFIYLILGTASLGLTAWLEGFPVWSALFHGFCIFVAAFDTGGFAPQSQSMIYYHSMAFEMVAVICMILGSINFRLHYALWSGQRKELIKDFEIIFFFFSVVTLTSLIIFGLTKTGTYTDLLTLFRKGFFQTISAHTGSGFSNIYSVDFINEWGSLAVFGIIFAMSLGGCANSTTGGIKMIRFGIVAQSFANDVKQAVLPEKAVFVKRIHHIKDMFLTDKQMRFACMILLAYITTFFIGGIVGMICGYPFVESFFESTSATANVGLSCGITNPQMPTVLKITYMIQMWAGRLEFMSIFVLLGFFLALIRGK